jgi:hypothetical protein
VYAWLVALGAGAAFALLQYGWRRTRHGSVAIIAALLRWTAVTLIVALLLDASAGRAKPVAPWVAIDASQSMARGDAALWRAAIDTAPAVRAESVLAFGDSTRNVGDLSTLTPRDLKSELRPLADRAMAAGDPVVVITDGEATDPDAVSALPSGSRLVILHRAVTNDLAVLSVDLPRAVVSGDTVTAQVTLATGAEGSRNGTLAIRVDGRDIVRTPVEGLAAFASRRVELRFPVSGPPGPAIVQAIATADGDVVRRNDTLTVAVDRSRSASAVFVSTTPDYDSRAALGLLRGALAMPARGFLRVAPGAWRVDGTLSPISEADVRAALKDAPIAVVHGDTAVLGAPRTITAAPIALIVPAADTTAEWYVSTAPTSPLSPGYDGVAWDSLPPLLVGAHPPKGSWTALEASAGRTGAPQPIVVGTDSPRRTVVVAASGFWRWQFRGGTSADAFAAFWGTIFDWLAGERADKRAAIPDAAFFRAGESIRWRRGSAADSVVRIVLKRRNGPSRSDSLTLRFATGTTVSESPPLDEGLYDVSTPGGASLLVIDPSTEWLPRQVKLRSGPVGSGVMIGAQPRLRDRLWLYGIVILCLCGEWLLRRTVGLR